MSGIRTGLAKMLALGTLPAVWVPPVAIREMRALLRHREGLVRDQTRCINRAKAVLRRHGYPLARQSDVRRYLAENDLNLPEGERFILASLVRQLDAVEAELRAVDAEMARRAQEVPAAVVQFIGQFEGVNPSGNRIYGIKK